MIAISQIEAALTKTVLAEEAIASRWEHLHVEDVMVRDLICVGPDETLDKVAKTMLERRIHRVLVTEGEHLLGVVSSLDLVGLFAEGRVEAR